MSVTVHWEGLAELRDALRTLPAELTAEASNIIQESANRAIADMKQEYPLGELSDKLYQSSLSRGIYGAGILIKNASGWAWHWDFGTKLRHRASGGATGAEWGATKPPHTFIQTMDKYRRQMYDRLKAFMERNGLRVTGEA